ncbi:hypothetical protein SAY87_008031 [Trapa incisa]|uniref:PLAC8 family protein n=1 Tax=Trapa incisa TaxID=236973 RepID=A0AAN7KFD2_9MYRT|nr:hypothetical protein SAY87_008031 [Trapa incisa]
MNPCMRCPWRPARSCRVEPKQPGWQNFGFCRFLRTRTRMFVRAENDCSGCAARGTTYGLLALTGFACLYSCFYRSKLRGQYDLVEAPCADCLVHFFCEACALCR